MLDVPVAVKKALKKGIYKKNYRFVVLNDDGTTDFTIDNDTLVAESVLIDERMATGSELKFGLCEGSSLEFEFFDHDNIRGRRIQAFIDVEYGQSTPYAIPMGFFTVDKCSMQASTGIFKATCYNKLMSKYLDEKANDYINGAFKESTSVMVAYLNGLLLGDYRIEPSYPGVTPESPTSGQVELPHLDSLSTVDVYLPQYGVDSPLNAYVYGTGKLHFGVATWRQIFELSSPSKLYYYFKKGSFVAFERAIYNFLIKALDDAHLMDVNGDPVSGQDIMDDFCRNQNFAYICGIKTPEDYINVKYYSTIQWEFEEANGLTHKVEGNSNDALIQNPYGIMVMMPLTYGLFPSSVSTGIGYSYDGSTYGGFGVYVTRGTYKYYMNSSLEVSDTKTVTKFGFNGSQYPTSEDVIEDWWGAFKQSYLGIEGTTVTIADLPDVTLRELQSATYELSCQYGQLDRQTDLFSGVELNGGGLYPADSLYPANSLYPNDGTGGQGFHPYPSEYSKLWTDTQGEQTFRYLIITYKTLDENNQEVDAVLQRTVNADGTTDYNMSDNWLFRNLVWTAADVGDYADAMVTKMQGIKWFPFEMWLAGLPYVETGDAIEITDRNGGTHTSYVLQRQLSGIQNLQDTYINGELDIF